MPKVRGSTSKIRRSVPGVGVDDQGGGAEGGFDEAFGAEDHGDVLAGGGRGENGVGVAEESGVRGWDGSIRGAIAGEADEACADGGRPGDGFPGEGDAQRSHE